MRADVFKERREKLMSQLFYVTEQIEETLPRFKDQRRTLESKKKKLQKEMRDLDARFSAELPQTDPEKHMKMQREKNRLRELGYYKDQKEDSDAE